MLRRLFVSFLVCLPLLTLTAKIASSQAAADGRAPTICAQGERHPAAPDSKSLQCEHCTLCPGGLDQPSFLTATGQRTRLAATRRTRLATRFDRKDPPSAAPHANRARAPPV